MHSVDLFEKKVSSLYAHYLLPTLLAMASNSLYCLADVYFVSKGAGSTALAAMNIAIPLYTLYSAIGLTFGVGAATVMSVAEGEKQPKVRNKAYTYGMIGMVIIGLCIALLGNLFADNFAYLLGSSEELLPLVKAYMIPINGMAVFFIVNYAASVILRNDHAPRLAMIATMAGNFSNIILDYIFVIRFGMGIFGAALATAIGPVISLGIMSLHFLRRKNTIHLTKDVFDYKIWKRILSNGFGSGVLEISAGAVIVIFNYVILKKADAMFLAAYAIITNIAYVGKGLLNGFAQASQPIISANYGAMHTKRVKEAFLISIQTSLYFSIAAYLICFIFSKDLAALFANNDAALIEMAAQGIQFYFISLPFTALITMFLYFFQSVEYGKVATLLAFLKGFIFILLGLFLLVTLFGINAIWFTVAFAEAFGVLLALLFYKKKFPYNYTKENKIITLKITK